MTYAIEDCKFIADVMLGKLAKWLRILGFDVLYGSNLDDESLLRIAKIDKRVILTKDKKLFDNAKKESIKVFFVKENSCFYQLKDLIKGLNLNKSFISPFKRCVRCNSLISPVKRKEVEGLVPDFIYNTVKHFSKCPGCGKIYWQGSHHQKVNSVINELFDK